MLIVPKSIYIEISTGCLLNLNQICAFSPTKHSSGKKFYYAHLPDGSMIPLSQSDFKALKKQFDKLHIAYGIKDEYCEG